VPSALLNEKRSAAHQQSSLAQVGLWEVLGGPGAPDRISNTPAARFWWSSAPQRPGDDRGPGPQGGCPAEGEGPAMREGRGRKKLRTGEGLQDSVGGNLPEHALCVTAAPPSAGKLAQPATLQSPRPSASEWRRPRPCARAGAMRCAEGCGAQGQMLLQVGFWQKCSPAGRDPRHGAQAPEQIREPETNDSRLPWIDLHWPGEASPETAPNQLPSPALPCCLSRSFHLDFMSCFTI
jgi:hypothetical protein